MEPDINTAEPDGSTEASVPAPDAAGAAAVGAAPAGTQPSEPAQPAETSQAADVELPPALDRPRPQRPPLISPAVPIVLGIVAAAVLLIVGLVAYTSSMSRVAVPDVVGVTEGVARARLGEAGFEMEVVSDRFSGEPAGTVLAQEPAAGTELKSGDVVGVVVSAGTEEFGLPDVIGAGLTLAKGQLETRGLIVRVVSDVSDLPSDTVLSSMPAPGMPVRTGDTITLTVASAGAGSNALFPYKLSGMVVTIDPGLPGSNPDAPLDVSRKLRSLLEASGASVITLRSTGDTGTVVTDAARSKRALEGSPTIAVGISIAPPSSSGVTIFKPATGDAFIVAQSDRLASEITTQLAAASVSARKSGTATDTVLAPIGVPWVRVGLAAKTGADTTTLFTDPAWTDSVARSIYRAIGEVYAPGGGR